MEADTIYAVRVWIDPADVDDVVGWLRAHHLADVVAQPGFLGARCIRLEQDSGDGWQAYLMLYGLQSRAALECYFADPITERFAQERKPFADTTTS